MAFEVREYDPSWEKEIADKLTAKFGNKIEITGTETRRIFAKAGRCDIHDINKFLRDELDFEQCANVLGVDYIDHMTVVYHIESYRQYRGVVIEISVDLPADDLHIPSMTDIWGGSNWNERETWELFGIVFDGHPRLERLLTPQTYQFFPFRKSYKLRGWE
jgi:NADH-quinone oxidoreductase subunit C